MHLLEATARETSSDVSFSTSLKANRSMTPAFGPHASSCHQAPGTQPLPWLPGGSTWSLLIMNDAYPYQELRLPGGEMRMWAERTRILVRVEFYRIKPRFITLSKGRAITVLVCTLVSLPLLAQIIYASHITRLNELSKPSCRYGCSISS